MADITMAFLFLAAVFAGVGIGTITGLVPGLHVNNAAILLYSLMGLSGMASGNVFIITLIISAAITHTFVDFIPSIFVGAPEESTSLSVLPGHRLMLRGLGYQAVVYSACAGVAGILLSIFSLPLLLKAGAEMYGKVKAGMPYLLGSILLFLVLTEKKKKDAILILFLSCMLGTIVLSLPMTSSETLTSMLTGLFGISTMVMSITTKPKVKKQRMNVRIVKKCLLKDSLLGTMAGTLSGLLPGVTSTQTSIIMATLSRMKNELRFISLLGAANTVHAFIAVMALFIISKPRSGVAVLLQEMKIETMMTHIIVASMLASMAACILTVKLAKKIATSLERFRYERISLAVLLMLVIMLFIQTSWLGMMVALTSSLLGILAYRKNVKKSLLMAALIFPIIINYVVV